MIRRILPVSSFGNTYSASFSSDGQRFAFGKTDGTTELWSVDGGLNVRRLASFAGEGPVYKTAISPDGRFIAARRGEGVSVFDVRRGIKIGTYQGLSAPFLCPGLQSSRDSAGGGQRHRAARRHGDGLQGQVSAADAVVAFPDALPDRLNVLRVDVSRRTDDTSLQPAVSLGYTPTPRQKEGQKLSD